MAVEAVDSALPNHKNPSAICIMHGLSITHHAIRASTLHTFSRSNQFKGLALPLPLPLPLPPPLPSTAAAAGLATANLPYGALIPSSCSSATATENPRKHQHNRVWNDFSSIAAGAGGSVNLQHTPNTHCNSHQIAATRLLPRDAHVTVTSDKSTDESVMTCSCAEFARERFFSLCRKFAVVFL